MNPLIPAFSPDDTTPKALSPRRSPREGGPLTAPQLSFEDAVRRHLEAKEDSRGERPLSLLGART